jgi:hypothetical protein
LNAYCRTPRLLRLGPPIAGEARTAPVTAEQGAGEVRQARGVRQAGSNEAAAATPGRDESSGATARLVALLVHAEAALRRLPHRPSLAGVLRRHLVVVNPPDPRQGLIRAGLLAARLGTPPPPGGGRARDT